jgi:5-methylthioribose kinase
MIFCNARCDGQLGEIIDRFFQNNPKNEEGIKKLGLRLRDISDANGAFRVVYKINGLDLVVKVPYFDSGILHSKAEIKALSRINRLKKYKIIREYMPDVYYANTKTGIIVMRYYKPLKYTKINIAAVSILYSLVESVWLECASSLAGCTDISVNNCGIDAPNSYSYTIKVIDLGCFLENK